MLPVNPLAAGENRLRKSKLLVQLVGTGVQTQRPSLACYQLFITCLCHLLIMLTILRLDSCPMHHDICCWRDSEFGCDRGFQGCGWMYLVRSWEHQDRQRSLRPASGGLAACFVRDQALSRASGCLFLPSNRPQEKPVLKLLDRAWYMQWPQAMFSLCWEALPW